MPQYITHECATCKKLSEPFLITTLPPQNWITLSRAGQQEWFDSWSCVATYAASQKDDEPDDG